MKIAIVGGGINGIMTAWELVKSGHHVIMFEKGEVMKQTSSASSKLLHGSLRYLENFEFKLVKESLKERKWWLKQAPHLVKPLKPYIPIYKTTQRSAWLYKMGLCLYDRLSGKENIRRHKSLAKAQIQQQCPSIKTQNLIRGFAFYDVQMDDYKLGIWVLDQAKKYTSLRIMERTKVKKITPQGRVIYNTKKGVKSKTFDKVINIAGPWAQQLLIQSDIQADYQFDLVRGSHILINRQIQSGYFLEMPGKKRMFFVLPYQNQTLIGTTEHRQRLSDDIKPDKLEIDNLIDAYNFYFKESINQKNISKAFAGLRPLIKSAEDATKTTREYALQINQNLITVFGGKWTTARKLAKKVAAEVAA